MKPRMLTAPPALLVISLGCLIGAGSGLALAADALTQHYNNARTGATLDETILNTTNVASGSFARSQSETIPMITGAKRVHSC